jgi:hypothetical protein
VATAIGFVLILVGSFLATTPSAGRPAPIAAPLSVAEP